MTIGHCIRLRSVIIYCISFNNSTGFNNELIKNVNNSPGRNTCGGCLVSCPREPLQRNKKVRTFFKQNTQPLLPVVKNLIVIVILLTDFRDVHIGTVSIIVQRLNGADTKKFSSASNLSNLNVTS